MEVEDSSEKQCNTSGVDVDSGIENMEVEESDRKELAPRSRVGSGPDGNRVGVSKQFNNRFRPLVRAQR